MSGRIVVSARTLREMQALTSDHGAMCPCDTCKALRGVVVVRRRRVEVVEVKAGTRDKCPEWSL